MPNRDHQSAYQGVFWGLLGVFVFSLTLPATRTAVPELGEVVVGLGRALVAAGLAAAVVIARRDPIPDRRHWPSLAVVVLGVVFGFPLLTSIAMRSAPASHGAVVIGLIPVATAVWATWLGGERLGVTFWLGCAGGVVSVLLFALAEGGGQLHSADALLLAASCLAGLGYAVGGRLSKEIASWRVLCWALIFAAPFAGVIVGGTASFEPTQVSPQAWLAFAWVSCGSMFGGFLAWYRGLALGGVARVGQVQLVQPVLTTTWSGLLLGESIGVTSALAAACIVAAATVCVRSRYQG